MTDQFPATPRSDGVRSGLSNFCARQAKTRSWTYFHKFYNRTITPHSRWEFTILLLLDVFCRWLKEHDIDASDGVEITEAIH
jgi:hypothetical protein